MHDKNQGNAFWEINKMKEKVDWTNYSETNKIASTFQGDESWAFKREQPNRDATY